MQAFQTVGVQASEQSLVAPYRHSHELGANEILNSMISLESRCSNYKVGRPRDINAPVFLLCVLVE